ncbi:aspartate aminotransferase [Rhizobium sp. Leaf384]|uniref:pyridoxal phosphate-dependent aminotransferase n=1 Tax=unclassified Rhizobium TaxID=2613769 RepID=UPI000713AD31|nr:MULTISPECIES: pyridoxal phosphate-dependent aminotransferase [unclassified Rhizobium]KQS81031.1 aspartate aminotransferase [Rhizobium sp. Leaf384]KQS86885.1 aspartate aminotransferase [Rhizobium sp. Leaf383]
MSSFSSPSSSDTNVPASISPSLSARAHAAPQSGIVEVVNYARGREGLIPLWVGEGDLPTPDFISQAARDSLTAGETFYTWQRGIPELRQAIVRYYDRHFNKTLGMDNVFVTGSGMQSIKLAVEAVASPGDELLYLTPAWPNFAASAELSGAQAVGVPLSFADGKWQLDLDRIEAAITPRTRALFVNTPSNPTGWTATPSDLVALLDLARRHGLWIIADEIYAQYFYAEARAPSFLDVMEDEDRIIFVNSFSKNWSMTGWRAGWIVAPAEIGQALENLIQYSTSGVAPFIQAGARVALDHGDDFVRQNVVKATMSRDILCDALIATNRVETLRPDGAIYAFLKIDGITDVRAAALDIVDRTLVGLAPGTAFGQGGAGFMRACFLRDPLHIRTAADRLASYIAAL